MHNCTYCRADSVCSLASSSSTQITAAEIRSLTNNYQRMLARATKQIKRLNVEKWKVEQEQDKLLNTNLELAEEVRKLIVSDKQWRKEKQVRPRPVQYQYLMLVCNNECKYLNV